MRIHMGAHTRLIGFALVALLIVTSAYAQAPATPVTARNGMVVAQEARAAEIGLEFLKNGGNAVDAAVATGFALAVTHPRAGNIGGGGFMVIRFPDGRTTAIDFREMAPGASNPEMFVENGEYSNDRHHNSYVSIGVPGTVA